MSKLTKTIMGAAILVAALAAATLPALAQETPAQPFTPYDGTNGGSQTYNGSNGQITHGPAPVQLYGAPRFGTYTGNNNSNYNPACDRNSRYYNPYQCR